ncbi:hypothetical protein BC830DRAFT_430138 [Chytriomyces sp. MP71]|nr:hypothetical protein BC830DRAFT_430138 [Chytriomyces sp. MP71]
MLGFRVLASTRVRLSQWCPSLQNTAVKKGLYSAACTGRPRSLQSNGILLSLQRHSSNLSKLHHAHLHPSRSWLGLGIAFSIGASIASASLWTSGGHPLFLSDDDSANGSDDDLETVSENDAENEEGDTEVRETEADTSKRLSNWALVGHILTALKPDALLVLAIVAVTACAAAVNIVTPIVIGQLVGAIQVIANAQSNGTGPVDTSDINAQALRLLGLFILQGEAPCCTFFHMYPFISVKVSSLVWTSIS